MREAAANGERRSSHRQASRPVLCYLRLGALGFGGPVALCGQMERELVQERKWLSRDEMRDGIAVCQSLPGPLAIQVGILVSYLHGGFWGAWAGGWAFILPGFTIVSALCAFYVHFSGLPTASVLLGRIAIGDWLTAIIALLSVVVLFRKISNPLLIVATAVVGIVAFPPLKPTWVFVK